MDKNTKILLLRYSDARGVDTVKEHIEVIDSDGYCWWAKIGKQPGIRHLETIMEQNEKISFLYSKRRLYKAKIISISKERPKQNYPAYYEKQIFNTDIEPSLYFAFDSIEKEPLSILDDYVVCSSGRKVLEDLDKSIGSYMLIQHKDMTLTKIQHKPSENILDKAK